MRHISFRTVIGATLFLSLSTEAPAAIIYVDQNAPGGTNNGTSWGTAFLKIQDAVDAAKAGDEVWVAKGTYDAGATVNGKPLAFYGGFAGTETVRGQRDFRRNVTTIARSDNGNGLACNETYTTISGFHLRNASVWAYLSTVRIFQNDLIGGGIGLFKSKGVVTRNTITASNVGVGCDESSVDLTDNTISACTTGVYAYAFDSVQTGLIAGNTVTGNRDGLSIALRGVTVVNNIIAFNGRTGISADPAWTIVLTNNVFGNGMLNYDWIPDMSGHNGNISVDPRLTSIYHDVHLKPDSPCRDLADPDYLYSVYDVDGQARQQGSGVDLGSDESDGSLQEVPTQRWYVRTVGNDANAGTSWAAAKATLTGALLAARGGDEVWVAEGTYTENLRVPAGIALYGGFAGTETSLAQRSISAHPTTIAAMNTNATVVWIENAWVRIDGFTIRGGQTGVVLTANAVLANCTVTHNAVGVNVGLGVPALTDNVIVDNSNDGVFIQHAVATVTGNLVDGNAGNGIWAGAGTYLTLTRNVVRRNNESGLSLDYGAWTDVHSNLFTLNSLAQVMLDNASTIYLHNNTLAGGGAAVGVSVNDSTAHLTNNAIVHHAGYGVRKGGTSGLLTMYGNDLYANSPNYENVPASIQQYNLSVDPQFVDPVSPNYHLSAGSPLIDAGYDSVVKPGDLDLDGRPRIQGARVDIGAYEFVSPGLLTMQDVLSAVRLSGGLSAAAAADIARWNVEEPATPLISLPDAVRLARKVAGLEPNP